MSAATIDRRLAADRQALQLKRRSYTKPVHSGGVMKVRCLKVLVRLLWTGSGVLPRVLLRTGVRPLPYRVALEIIDREAAHTLAEMRTIVARS